MSRTRPLAASNDEGYILLAAILMIFLVLLALSVAAPRVATQLKHEQEMETQHRANQYVRAIRIYYQKFHNYPPSLDALDKTNNQKFLRQHYLDPLTGKEDWRFIKVGDNKTTVKGFFGEDLPGMAPGLGAASGMSSGTGGSSFGSSVGGAPGGSGTGTTGGPGSSAFGGTSGGIGGASSIGGTTGTSTGTSGSNTDSSSSSGTGSTSQIGPFMGVGVSKDGEAMLTVNEKSTYQDWEFLYDPRIEALYAKGNLLGGGGVGSSSSSSTLGGTPGSSSPFGSSPGASGGTGTTGSTGTTPTVPTSPPTSTPQ